MSVLGSILINPCHFHAVHRSLKLSNKKYMFHINAEIANMNLKSQTHTLKIALIIYSLKSLLCAVRRKYHESSLALKSSNSFSYT